MYLIGCDKVLNQCMEAQPDLSKPFKTIHTSYYYHIIITQILKNLINLLQQKAVWQAAMWTQAKGRKNKALWAEIKKEKKISGQ